VRRSRLDIRLGQTLTVGQRLRRRVDNSLWTIRQLHRYDCHADLQHPDGRKITVPFSELRQEWERVVPLQEAA
jgi:hypothetical protein